MGSISKSLRQLHSRRLNRRRRPASSHAGRLGCGRSVTCPPANNMRKPRSSSPLRDATGERTSSIYDSPKQVNGNASAHPTAKSTRPAIIVIQENRGLNPHIEDVARRLAVEGFLAFAPDLLSVSGGTPPDEDQARELHGRTNPQDITAAAVAAVPFVLAHAESNGNVGVVGFCFGGAWPSQRRRGLSSIRGGLLRAAGLCRPGAAHRAPLLLHYSTDQA